MSFKPRLEAFEDRCLLSGGALDPTFGSGGMLSTAIGSSDSSASAVATYPAVGTANDGKIVVAGYTTNPQKSSTGDENFAVVRYNLNGTPDLSFGGTGKVTTDLGTTLDVAKDVAVQPDGKVVAAGYAGGNFAVVRYNLDGSLDTSFGGKAAMGKVITHVGGTGSYDQGYSLALQPDGKIVVAGITSPKSSGVVDLAVVRYNANGTLDTTFGSGGKAVTGFAEPVWDGGPTNMDLAIDPGSGPADPNAGKIVVGAQLNYEANPPYSSLSYAVVRLNTNGSLDTSFGSTGYTTFSTPNFFTSLAVQPDDRVVLAGFFQGAATGSGLELVRLNPDAALDESFGSGGVMRETPPTPNTAFSAQSVALQADGKIVVAGRDGANFMAARFSPTSGSPDAAFGSNGIAVWPVAAYDTADVALEPDGRIVVAGTTVNASHNSTFAAARFLASGPEIGALTAAVNPAASGSIVTLTAAGIADPNPGSTVAQVSIYLDANGDGTLQPGADTLLGNATLTGNGTWMFTTAGLAPGTYTFFAVAEDSFAVFGDPVSITVSVT